MADHDSTDTCKSVSIAKDVCYVRFAGGKVERGAELSYVTARGEDLILDLDADGRVVGMPCQQ